MGNSATDEVVRLPATPSRDNKLVKQQTQNSGKHHLSIPRMKRRKIIIKKRVQR